jgi:pyruvate/2-oxoglutarate dehydrogenase complex dihydrolipoamide dehydrogenase (E3) component
MPKHFEAIVIGAGQSGPSLGIEGDEVVHVITDVMYAYAPHTVISRAVHAHPTVSELLPTTLQQLEPHA